MIEVANWLFSFGSSLFSEMSSNWGIIGFGLIFSFVIVRVVNFIKRFFK